MARSTQDTSEVVQETQARTFQSVDGVRNDTTAAPAAGRPNYTMLLGVR